MPGATGLVIRGMGKDISGERTGVTALCPPFAKVALPTGRYLAVAEKDGDRKEAEFEIRPGERTSARIAFP